MNVWIAVWTVVVFVGLGVFTVMAAMVIYNGARDILHMLRALQAQHEGAAPTAEE